MRTLAPSDHVVVVGAGFAGWRFAEALRREGFEGVISLLGDEPYAPYDRPPLSKHVLSGKWDVDKTTLATPELVARYDVNLHLGVRVEGLDVATTTVHLADGVQLAGTHVVIATGVRARRLGFSAGDHLAVLRSRDDAFRLIRIVDALDPDSEVAIIGGGFIGAEVATSLRARGLRPIVLEALERPLIGVLGPDVSSWIADLASHATIELRTNQRITDVRYDDPMFTILFDNDSFMIVSAVIVAAGAIPNVEWLVTSGLTIDNGVVVDERMMATDRVAAIGDVARFNWRSVVGDELVRIEHWQVANDHANVLAHYWMQGEVASGPIIPYFWSDQYGAKIQMLGHPHPGDDVIRVGGSVEERKWVAIYSSNGIVNGVVALGQPRALMLSKGLLEEPTSLEEALRRAPWAR